MKRVKIMTDSSDTVSYTHLDVYKRQEYELPNKIYLFQGLPKADKMELIIQKAVELGAFSIIPLETKRCVVKLDVKKAAKKVDVYTRQVLY